jgi:hypothetical protein
MLVFWGSKVWSFKVGLMGGLRRGSMYGKKRRLARRRLFANVGLRGSRKVGDEDRGEWDV